MKKVQPRTLGPAGLKVTWVPVTVKGRTRMEMRWSAPQPLRRTA